MLATLESCRSCVISVQKWHVVNFRKGEGKTLIKSFFKNASSQFLNTDMGRFHANTFVGCLFIVWALFVDSEISTEFVST